MPIEGDTQGRTGSIFCTSGPLKGHLRGAWNALEGLTLGLVSLDRRPGWTRTSGIPWGNRELRNKVFANPRPFTDFSRLLMCRSRADPLGIWFEEERNLYADYQLAFSAESPLLIGIGIMTDTDNTGESATAY